MNLTVGLSKCKIILTLIFIWAISCKKVDLTHSENGQNMNATNPNSDCIHFVHPEWIDEITYFDTTVENYNSIVLKAFLKNSCRDTIALGMYKTRLTIDAVKWYFHGETGGDLIMARSDSFHVLLPGDSMYFYLTELRSDYVHKVDSVKIHISYKVKNQGMDKMVMIDGHNFTYRE